MYSVERLLLDLVNASLSRRVTRTLAETTTETLNAITAGLSRLAGQTGAGSFTRTIELASLQEQSACPVIEHLSYLEKQSSGLKGLQSLWSRERYLRERRSDQGGDSRLLCCMLPLFYELIFKEFQGCTYAHTGDLV